eukprot:jgi/Botrbrau1/1443/Bobra.178_3s0001.1
MNEMLSRPEPDEKNTSIWAQLLRAKKHLADKMDLPRLCSEIAITIYASTETTGHTLTWALFEVSQAPHVEKKLLQEYEQAGLLPTAECPSPREITYSDVSKLPYTAAVIKEALRLYPAIPILYRKAMVDLQVGPYVIPKGTVVVCSLSGMHNNKSNFPSPSTFDPERHLTSGSDLYHLTATEAAALHASRAPANLSKKLPPDCRPVSRPIPDDTPIKKYAPFAEGPRACIGMPMGWMTIMTALPMLLSAFHFELAPSMGGKEGVSKTEEYAISPVAANGIHMLCHQRPCRVE